jgi:cyclase
MATRRLPLPAFYDKREELPMIFRRKRHTTVLFKTALCVSAWALPPLKSAAFLNQLDVARMSGSGQDVRKIVIAESIYQFMTMRDGYVRQLNSVVVVNENDVLVFDTNTRPSTARVILAEIRKITDKPVRYVVNSHWHPDHWSGNEVYAQAFPGLEITATEQTRQFMQNAANAWPARFTAELKQRQAAVNTATQVDAATLTPEQRAQEEDDLQAYASFVQESTTLHRIYPTLTYADSLTLRHGGREFRFVSVTGDAEGTTVLYLPHEKILITGDAVSFPIPYTAPPPSRQAKSLDMLAQLDVDVIIPGHGPAFHDKVFLNLERELIEAVIEGVHGALQKGMLSLDEVQQAVTVEELRVKFTHNDSDLDARYRNRVKELVDLAIREQRDGQGYR